MTDQRGLPFLDAVKELAAAAGMEVPGARSARRAAGRARAIAARCDRGRAGLVHGAVSTGWRGRKRGPICRSAGSASRTRRAFGLGFSPDSRSKLKTAIKQFPEEMLVETGMLILPEDEPNKRSRESYDRFRGRLMIPIRDQRGRVIAFGGRILGAGEPKYLNSPETPALRQGPHPLQSRQGRPRRAQVRPGDRRRGLYGRDRRSRRPALPRRSPPLGTRRSPSIRSSGSGRWSRRPSSASTATVRASAPPCAPHTALCPCSSPATASPLRRSRRARTRTISSALPGGSLRSGAGAGAIPLVELIWRSEETSLLLETPEQRAGLRQRLNELCKDHRGHRNPLSLQPIFPRALRGSLRRAGAQKQLRTRNRDARGR